MQGLVSGYASDSSPVARGDGWSLALPASLAVHAVFFTAAILASLLRTTTLPEVQAPPLPVPTWWVPTLVRAEVAPRLAGGGARPRRNTLAPPAEAPAAERRPELVPTVQPSSYPTEDMVAGAPGPSGSDDPTGGDNGFGAEWTGNGSGNDPGPGPGSDPPPVRPGGAIQPPSKLRHVDPVYPEIARVTRQQGTVLLECTIDVHGRVVGTRVLRSVPLLDRAALEAVQRWVYPPTRLNGVPVAVVMTVTVRFTLSGR